MSIYTKCRANQTQNHCVVLRSDLSSGKHWLEKTRCHIWLKHKTDETNTQTHTSTHGYCPSASAAVGHASRLQASSLFFPLELCCLVQLFINWLIFFPHRTEKWCKGEELELCFPGLNMCEWVPGCVSLIVKHIYRYDCKQTATYIGSILFARRLCFHPCPLTQAKTTQRISWTLVAGRDTGRWEDLVHLGDWYPWAMQCRVTWWK